MFKTCYSGTSDLFTMNNCTLPKYTRVIIISSLLQPHATNAKGYTHSGRYETERPYCILRMAAAIPTVVCHQMAKPKPTKPCTVPQIVSGVALNDSASSPKDMGINRGAL